MPTPQGYAEHCIRDLCSLTCNSPMFLLFLRHDNVPASAAASTPDNAYANVHVDYLPEILETLRCSPS